MPSLGELESLTRKDMAKRIFELQAKVKLLEKRNNTLREIILAQSAALPDGTFNLLGGEDIMDDIIEMCQAKKEIRAKRQLIRHLNSFNKKKKKGR